LEDFVIKPEERQKRIFDFLRAAQRDVSIEEMSNKFKVSSLTIRRDLSRIADSQGIIITPGGAVYVGDAVQYLHFNKRVAINWELKHAVGVKAASLVEDGSVILVNTGSTISHLATNLPTDKKLTVYTTSLSLMTDLKGKRNIKLYVLGGEFNPNYYSLMGSMSEVIIEGLRVDMTFLGTDGIDEKGNCLCETPEVARTTQLMLRAGKRKILLSDHTKLNSNKGYVTYATLSDFDEWITTPGIPDKIKNTFNNMTKISEVSEKK
jgi:DeoR/GlpR family transcriptional regulator of sugar metabolism